MNVESCDSLGLQDMALVAGTAEDPGYSVFWYGSGSSTWTDVDIVGSYAGWLRLQLWRRRIRPPVGRPLLLGVQHDRRRLCGFSSGCGESWYYGGEIRVDPALAGGFATPDRGAVDVSNRSDVRVFGAAVRASTANVSGGSGRLRGVMVGSGGGCGEFHMHGGAISVKQREPARGERHRNIRHDQRTGERARARARTLDAAFAVKGGSTSTRLSGTETSSRRQLWEARTDPPAAGGAKDGQDIYVETDCDASGCSGASDPHLMIYKASCTPTPWFDSARNACRS